MSKLQTPKFGSFNQFTNLQLYCNKDGILRVKNGMTLEEYLNHPHFIKARKAGMRKSKIKGYEFIIVDSATWSKISMPHSA